MRYQHQALCLNSALQVTRGNLAGVNALLALLHPTQGSCTCVVDPPGDDATAIGQMLYRSGDRSAMLSFLLPARASDTPAAAALLDELSSQAGSMGALNMRAAVSEDTPIFENLRRAGYTVYSWQRIWQVPVPISSQTSGRWELATGLDIQAVQTLYNSLVPPLVQAAESLSLTFQDRWVFRLKGVLLGYADVHYGSHGIYIEPVIHPTVEDLPAVLFSLIDGIPSLGRSAYLGIRADQAFVEHALDGMGASCSPRLALFVKYLVRMQRVGALAQRHALREDHHPEPTLPFIPYTSPDGLLNQREVQQRLN
ncbi:MAG TPA: hypothetical protein VN376_01945 [Longilinea sp.]|nr:hypothetical protein [Longilinea sp.]